MREQILAYADGDARRLLNLLESLFTTAAAAGVTEIDEAFLQSTMASSLRRFDKGGEAFYDQISALHKSVRGSDPDAALYWFYACWTVVPTRFIWDGVSSVSP